METGKMERDVVGPVDTERLVPREHLLRKVDKAVDFRKLYEIVEPLQRGACTAERDYSNKRSSAFILGRSVSGSIPIFCAPMAENSGGFSLQ